MDPLGRVALWLGTISFYIILSVEQGSAGVKDLFLEHSTPEPYEDWR